MHEMRQAAAGILGAMLSAIVVLGSIALALAEGGIPAAQAPAQPAVTQFVFPTPQPGQPTFTASPTPPPTATATPPASVSCPPPAGWISIEVAPGETLAEIASQYGISAMALMQANCLISDELPWGVVLAVPNFPPTETPAPTAAPNRQPTEQRSACVPDIPSTWIRYTIRRGDTLSSIARARYITWQELYRRNCLTSTNIITGQVIYVPGVATRTPTAIPTLPPSSTPVTPSITTAPPPSSTPIANPTATPTATPLDTAIPSPTPTSTPTAIPPTNTPLPTDTPTPQDTATPKPPDE